MNLIIGFPLVALSVLGGFYVLGGNLWVLWQPAELLIIVGTAIGAFIIANPRAVIIDSLREVGGLVRRSNLRKQENLELFTLMFLLFGKNSEEMKALEKDLDTPMSSNFFRQFDFVQTNPRLVRFIADYLRLVTLGEQKPHELEPLLDSEIDAIEHEMQRVPRAINQMAESLPAIGIVAAVLGVIKAMGSIAEPPEVLGLLIGGAMVGTFLGVLLSYGLVGPIANAIKARREQDLEFFLAIKSAFMAFMNNYSAAICVEYGRKTLSVEQRPSFEELEDAMTGAKTRFKRR